MTPLQRIDRLKKKIVSKQLVNARNDTTIQSVPVANVSVSNTAENQHPAETPSSIENMDIYFVEDDDRIVQDETNGAATSHQISNESTDIVLNSRGNDQSKKTIENSTSESTDIRTMLITLNGKIDDMNGEIFSLRRQIARVEAKTTIHQKPNETHRTSEMDDAFLDFEATLAAEGLPIRSINGVNALENRLKDTAYSASSYRQKLVCIFFDIPGISI